MNDPFCLRTSGHRGRVVTWCGHQQIELESPELRVRISATRGAEIQQILHKASDTELLWCGHPGIARNDQGAPSVHRPEGNYLDHFSGGWQVVLPTANYPAAHRGASFGQHGEAALLPWSFLVTSDDPAGLEVLFMVELRNAPLLVERRIRLEASSLTVTERVSNLGTTAHDVQWGQHITLSGEAMPAGTTVAIGGSPLVTVPASSSPTYRFSEGTTVWPRVINANHETEDASLLGPNDQSEGHLIIGPLVAGEVIIRPPSSLPAFSLHWDADTHPYCWIWEVLGGHDSWPLWGRHRLIAIEPFNVPLERLDDSIESGRATRLNPGSAAENTFSLRIHRQSDAQSEVRASSNDEK